MRDGFCDWCVKCAKYLAFGTFERADDSALKEANSFFFFERTLFNCFEENTSCSGFSFLSFSFIYFNFQSILLLLIL